MVLVWAWRTATCSGHEGGNRVEVADVARVTTVPDEQEDLYRGTAAGDPSGFAQALSDHVFGEGHSTHTWAMLCTRCYELL